MKRNKDKLIFLTILKLSIYFSLFTLTQNRNIHMEHAYTLRNISIYSHTHTHTHTFTNTHIYKEAHTFSVTKPSLLCNNIFQK